MSNQQLLKGLKLLYTRETVVINGYIIPCVAIIVLVTNTFVVLVYKKQYQQIQNKIRKISSILYISIATSNSLAVLPTSIWYVYLFTFGNVASIVPYNLCWTWNFFTAFEVFPHMASIWFVTILSVQRFMVIRHPFVSIKQWTIKRMFFVVIIIWIITLSIQMPHIFDTSFGPKEILINATTNRSAIFGCYVYYADWLNNSGETMEILWYTLKLVGIVIIPSILIIYSDASLILFLRESANLRKVLVKMSSVEQKELASSVHSEKPNLKCDWTNTENRHQTLLVIILSSIVFIVEIPYAVLLAAYIHFMSVQNYDIVRWFWIGPAGNIISLTMHVSYPTLFILSCLFSRQFRKLLLNMCKSKHTKFRPSNKKIVNDNTTSNVLLSIKSNSK